MNPINQYQFKQMVCSLARTNVSYYDQFEGNDEFLKAIIRNGTIRFPESSVYVIPERTAVFAAIGKSKSWLLRQLADRPEDTAFVIDSIWKGAEALFFIRLTSMDISQEILQQWLRYTKTQRIFITMKPVDKEYNVLVAAASCFVSQE